MDASEALLPKRPVVRALDLSGEWLRGPDAFRITLHHSRLCGAVWSIDTRKSFPNDFVGVVYEDSCGTCIKASFGADKPCVGHVQLSDDGLDQLVIVWPTGRWVKESRAGCCDRVRRMFCPRYSDSDWLLKCSRGWYMRLTLNLSPTCHNLVDKLFFCMKTVLLLFLLVTILSTGSLFCFPRSTILMTSGVRCPNKMHNSTEQSMRSLYILNCNYTNSSTLYTDVSQSCMDKVVLGMEVCGLVMQERKSSSLDVPILSACFVSLSAVALVGFLYLILGFRGLKVGARVPTWWYLSCAAVSACCVALFCIVQVRFELILFFLIVVAGLFSIILSLRGEMSVLAEPPQRWPCVSASEKAIEAVQDFELDCATCEEMYDFRLEVMEVFAIENQSLDEVFVQGCGDLVSDDPNIQQLYFGCSAEEAKAIAAKGFQLESDHSVGGLCVFDTPLAAWGHSRTGFILAFDVACGCVKEMRMQDDRHRRSYVLESLRDPYMGCFRYDSEAYSIGSAGNEITIYRASQFSPRFIFRVRQKPKVSLGLPAVIDESSNGDEAWQVEDGMNACSDVEVHSDLAASTTFSAVPDESSKPRTQRRSHNQRRRVKNWRKQVQVATPEASE
eukprot:TRINITY_DN11127_c0_g1_i3.p1 TRINITY_DN11127_c0_g1~~TRINITY_DN11127_c0_g1_i3.p1  ORF type:complete len:615 (-),score=30.25 TRINITY_DN11127_c0_g1_i3:376-2220(-)